MREKRKGKVYCFSREPGGAEMVALTLKGQTRGSYVLIGKDYACNVFDSHGLIYEQYCGTTREELYTFLDGLQEQVSAAVVLTSATSISEVDMTEKYAWQWAAFRKVPSIAVLDQWQNYKERFSGPCGTKYLADVICVMDESARQGMIQAGIPEERITITGHPSLSLLRRIMVRPNVKEIADVRKELKLNNSQRLILFVSEPFSHYYGDDVGFTELTVLRELLSYFQKRLSSMSEVAENTRLVIKLHPKDSLEIFSQFKREFAGVWEALSPVIMTNEIDKVSLLLASDLVIGMASIMLMEAIALGRPTVSIQVGAKTANLCEAVNQGIIPRILTQNEMCQVLDSLLCDLSYKEHYMNAIKKYPIIEDAETRVWEIVESRRLRWGTR